MTTATITIRVPGRVLSPNGRVHWAAKSKAKRDQRTAAWAECNAHGFGFKWDRASVQVRWFCKTANGLRMDHDNLIGSLKAAIDGVVDAGLLTDDRGVTWLPPVVAVDKANPRVELTFSRVAAKGE